MYIYETKYFCDIVFVNEFFGVKAFEEHDRDTFFGVGFQENNYESLRDYEETTMEARTIKKKLFKRTYLGTIDI